MSFLCCWLLRKWGKMESLAMDPGLAQKAQVSLQRLSTNWGVGCPHWQEQPSTLPWANRKGKN